MIRVLSLSEPERASYRRAAQKAAARFSFETTAQGVLGVYRRALARAS